MYLRFDVSQVWFVWFWHVWGLTCLGLWMAPSETLQKLPQYLSNVAAGEKLGDANKSTNRGIPPSSIRPPPTPIRRTLFTGSSSSVSAILPFIPLKLAAESWEAEVAADGIEEMVLATGYCSHCSRRHCHSRLRSQIWCHRRSSDLATWKKKILFRKLYYDMKLMII